NPNTPEEKERCEALYVGILETCTDQIEGAAKMARCRDTKVWPVAAREEEMEVIEEPAQEIPTTISGPEVGTQQPLRPEGTTRPPNRITEIIRSSQSTKRAGKKP